MAVAAVATSIALSAIARGSSFDRCTSMPIAAANATIDILSIIYAVRIYQRFYSHCHECGSNGEFLKVGTTIVDDDGSSQSTRFFSRWSVTILWISVSSDQESFEPPSRGRQQSDS